MPLGYWTSGIGKHVRPVAQSDSCSSITHKGLSNGVVASKFIIVEYCDDNLHFLKGKRNMHDPDKLVHTVLGVSQLITGDKGYLYLLKGDFKAETLIKIRI